MNTVSTELRRTTAAPFSGARDVGISAASIAVIAASALVYVSQSFVVAEALGVKRPVQALLAVPIVLMATYYWVTSPRRLLDPLIGFVVLKTVAELAFRGTALDLFDDVATLFGLAVITAAPARAAVRGARLITVLAGLFALLALVQWIWLFFDPDLIDELLTLDEEGKVVGGVHHVIALLGMVSGEHYTLLGHPVSRLQSFAMEPSLNIVYFLIPSAIAFLRGGMAGRFWGVVTLAYSVLSLSGSVFLSLAFSGAAWLALRMLSVKTVLAWGTMLILGGYLAAVRTGSLNAVISLISFLSNYGDFLSKEQSFTFRAGGTAGSLAAIAGAPLGSSSPPELPGPWMVNGALMAGWLGALMLVLFLRKLATDLQLLNDNRGRQLNVRIGTLILIGVLATVVVFNDYKMTNYPGLVLLGLICRMIEAQNEVDRDLHRAAVAPRTPIGPEPAANAPTAAHAAKAL